MQRGGGIELLFAGELLAGGNLGGEGRERDETKRRGVKESWFFARDAALDLTVSSTSRSEEAMVAVAEQAVMWELNPEGWQKVAGGLSESDTPGGWFEFAAPREGCESRKVCRSFWHPSGMQGSSDACPEVFAGAATPGYLLASLRLGGGHS